MQSQSSSIIIRIGNVRATVGGEFDHKLLPSITRVNSRQDDGVITLERNLHNFWEVGDGLVTVPSGLAYRVGDILQSNGHRVEIELCYQMPHRCTIDDEVSITAHDSITQEFIEKIELLNYGQVIVGDETQRLGACELIARRYPLARILFAIKSRSAAKEFKNQFPADLPVSLARGRSWAASTRLVACTYDALLLAYQDLCDVIVLPFGEETISKRLREALSDLARSFRFTIVKSPVRESPWKSLDRESWFGPPLFVAPNPKGLTEPTVRVLYIDGPAVDDAGGSAAEVKHLCESHEGRNHFIAQLAQQHRDLGKRVLVVAESAFHVHELMRLLPDWTSHTAASGVRMKGLPPVDHGISTLTYLANMKLYFDVVINAVGGAHAPDLVGIDARRTRPHETLLLDISSGSVEADSNAQSRLAEYKRRNWVIESPCSEPA